MIYENYGLRFIRLRAEHLELLRYWRNHNSIKQFMEYQENITSEMQKKWFTSVQKDKSSLYFLIEYDHNFIGMINGKNINFEKSTAEGGMFIWNLDFHNTEFPIRSILSFADFAFLFCKIEHCYINIMKDNKKAIELNKNFGYKLIEGQEEKENQRYVVSAKDFLESTLYFKKHYKKNYNNHPSIKFEQDDFKYNWANFYLKKCCDENMYHTLFDIEVVQSGDL